MKMTGVALAGGKGTRLGYPKAFLRFKGKSALQGIVSRLKTVCEEVLVVTGQEIRETAQAEKMFGFSRVDGEAEGESSDNSPWPDDVEIIDDLLPEHGPLGGVFTGLAAASHSLVFVVSCDSPLFSPDLARALPSYAEDADIVVPEKSGKLQPLQAMYRRHTGLIALRRLRERQWRVMDFLRDDALRLRVVREEEWASNGVPEWSFANVNTPEDYRRLTEWIDKPAYADYF
jgi:molybdopterin-guanine dinucleotide biosynthesis protein A